MDLSRTEIVKLKREAAEAAGDWLLERYDSDENIFVGAGSGSTVAYAFPKLAKFAHLVAVPTSRETRAKLDDLGVSTGNLEERGRLLFDVDGADEVDGNLNLIKGGGGCHYREKRVATRSELLVIIVDERKLVDYLGQRFPLPVEVIPEKKDDLTDRLRDYGEPHLRVGGSGPFYTDNDNLIVDVDLGRKYDEEGLEVLERELNEIDGVVENGLFVRRKADVVFVGTGDGVKIIKNEEA